MPKKEKKEYTESMLNDCLKKIEWVEGDCTSFSEGWAINFLIRKYKIRSEKIGHGSGFIAIATKWQIMLWKDLGLELEFLGILQISKEIKRK